MNLPQATAEETGRELHRMARTYRSEAYATIGSYMGMNLLVRSEYDFSGTFDRKADELARLKQECRELQRRIDEALKEAEQKPHPAQEDIDKAA